MDIDDLVREARELREKLALTAVKLEAFTEQLQHNVNRLRDLSREIATTNDEAGEPGARADK